MWQEMVFEVVRIVFVVAAAAIGSGWLATALTQALKWKAIALPAQKYPTVFAAVLSFLLAVPAVYFTGLVEIVGWVSYVVIAVASLFVSVQTYDTVKAAILQLKDNSKS